MTEHPSPDEFREELVVRREHACHTLEAENAYHFAENIIDAYEAALAEVERLTPDDVRRIVACVNACQGIPTEALEDGIIEEMVAMLRVAKGTLENIPEDSLGYESDGEKRWPLVKEIHSRITSTLDRFKGGDEA